MRAFNGERARPRRLDSDGKRHGWHSTKRVNFSPRKRGHERENQKTRTRIAFAMLVSSRDRDNFTMG